MTEVADRARPDPALAPWFVCDLGSATVLIEVLTLRIPTECGLTHCAA